MNLNVVVSDGTIVTAQVNKYSNTLNDLIAKVNEERSNKITVTLIVINGNPVKSDEFSKTLSNWELDDGQNITISEYYDGGFFYRLIINFFNCISINYI